MVNYYEERNDQRINTQNFVQFIIIYNYLDVTFFASPSFSFCLFCFCFCFLFFLSVGRYGIINTEFFGDCGDGDVRFRVARESWILFLTIDSYVSSQEETYLFFKEKRGTLLWCKLILDRLKGIFYRLFRTVKFYKNTDR